MNVIIYSTIFPLVVSDLHSGFSWILIDFEGIFHIFQGFSPIFPHLGLEASSNGFGHLPTDLATPDATLADTHGRSRLDQVGQQKMGWSFVGSSERIAKTD